MKTMQNQGEVWLTWHHANISPKQSHITVDRMVQKKVDSTEIPRYLFKYSRKE